MIKLTGYTDGGARVSNPGLGACAFVLYANEQLLHKGGKFLGSGVTNNVAEYRGLLFLLEYLKANQLDQVLIHSDSQLIVNQVNGSFKSANPFLTPLRNYARVLLADRTSQLKWIPREKNTAADAEYNRILDEIQKGKPE